MSDSRVDILTAHYVKETPHPEVVGVEELRKEAIWHIKDMEAAGLVVIDVEDEKTKRIIANAITTGQNSRPLGFQDEYSQRMWLTVADHVVNCLRDAE